MSRLHPLAVLTSFAVLCVMQGARADTGYYLVTTYPDEGRRAVDFKYWAARPDGKPTPAAPEIGLSYNVNSRWYTELTAAAFKYGAGATHLSGIEWQNDFMLTQGQYPIDVAFHTNVERATDGSGQIGIEYGPVLQTEAGRTQFNLNVFFQRELHAEEREPTELAYQWQVKYRWREKLQFGVQGFGEVGEWNHWLPRREQSHRAGPALMGSWRMGAQEWKYEAALLFGKNAGRHAQTFSTRIQYAF